MIRCIEEKDLPQIRDFVSSCPPLGVHTLYTYWVLLHCFGDLCFISEEEGRINGIITGVASAQEPDCAFLWQIGIAGSERGKGLSRKLIESFFEAAGQKGIRRIQLTIDPENTASLKTFRRWGGELRKIDSISLFDQFSKESENEDLYEILIG